ncbi:MAG: VOC family protein [Alphaproteobacteria bacterium]|nr:VOC family protein [Alphaproteobacteria bacterium]
MVRDATFIWNELVTNEEPKCGAFYSALLGWTRKEVDIGPAGTYTVFQKDGEDVAGMMRPATEFSRARPPFWSAYIAVDDIDACAARVAALGGQIIAEPEDIPDVGRVCMLTDPCGAPVCLMTPVSKAGQTAQ